MTNNWYSVAPKIASAQNASVNYTTGKTPYEIVCGTNPPNPIVLEAWALPQQTQTLLFKILQRFTTSLS